MIRRFYFLFLVFSALWLHPLYGQSDLTASGLVMSENGTGLSGVSVTVKQSPTKGGSTGVDGRFRITDLQEGHILVFSLVGFEKVEIPIEKTDELMRVVLTEVISELEEAIVVGHSTQRKISVTGAVTNVNVDELKVPATSIANMLGGRVPGIVSVLRSGEPGQDMSQFWIRGISTFGAGSSALVLIDGVEGNINTLDPEDIASFTILRDASATAVYGVRGANGVILI
ncbi:MAG TPA: TonB-dependent receptor plug domain-containing protein, partial [Parapedobacter sp.]|nr:TonB-dependent receptor plug domain-containing protein [Parapedobacter sp.]